MSFISALVRGNCVGSCTRKLVVFVNWCVIVPFSANLTCGLHTEHNASAL